MLPPLSDEECAALRADIRRHGVLVPVEVDEDGIVLDEHHRLRRASRWGWPITAGHHSERFRDVGGNDKGPTPSDLEVRALE